MTNKFWIISTAFIFMCGACFYASQTLMAGFEYKMKREADATYIKNTETNRHISVLNKVVETVELAAIPDKIAARRTQIKLGTQIILALGWLSIFTLAVLVSITLWRFKQWSYLHAHTFYPNKNGDWPVIMMNGRVHILDAGLSYDEAEVRKIEPLLLQARTATRLNASEVRVISGTGREG